jgi:hypothetical protein
MKEAAPGERGLGALNRYRKTGGEKHEAAGLKTFSTGLYCRTADREWRELEVEARRIPGLFNL